MAAGRRPFFVCSSGGATNTGAVDPLPELAEIAKSSGAWFHVDAAYGGFAVLTERGREALRGLDVERVHFMGGEPTTNPLLPEVLARCKRELGLRTFLGHTNGSGLVIENLDGTNVSLKAFDPEKHLEYTGQPRDPVYDNLRASFEAGLEVKASCVYIPGYIAEDEIAGMTDFLASLSPEIPFHIMGYIPVPGAPWRRPTDAEMEGIVALARERMAHVGFSHLTPEQAVDLTARDDRFKVVQVL